MIETVLGPIAPAALGTTSMHEHLLADCTALHRPAREPLPADQRVTLENLGFVRWNLLALKDNLILDDPGLATSELKLAHALGQRAVVDLTSWGLGPRYAELPAISRATGMHIAAGYGAYLGRTHPDWLREIDDLEQHFGAALTGQIPGCDFRAALLGMIGTSAPLEVAEERVLRAAARAAGRAGACVSVRLDPAGRLGLKILQICQSEGLPPASVIFGNVDEFMDPGYLADLAGAGATLEWCFGNEAYYHDRYKDPADAERLDVLCTVLAGQSAWSVVLGCSVWTKSQLRAFGGMGYGHLMGRIVPALLRRGIPEQQITELLVDRPAALLDRPDDPLDHPAEEPA